MPHDTYHHWKWSKNGNISKKTLRSHKRTSIKVHETLFDEWHCGKKEIKEAINDKRSICNQRISDRPLVSRIPINPFMSAGTYLEDLEVQDRYLRPKDSNIKEEE